MASIEVQEGKGPDLERLVAEARPGVRDEPGCLRYDLQRQCASATDYALLECSTEALEEHMASGALKAFAGKLRPLVAKAPVIAVYEPVGDQVDLA